MASVRYERDTGKLQKEFEKVIGQDFPLLSDVPIIYTFRDSPQYDEDGIPIAASARKINNHDRDIYGYYFEINVHRETWDDMSKEQKYRLAWHELYHCQVSYDEDTGELIFDDNGNYITWLEPHDIVMKTFRAEIEKFGLFGADKTNAVFLAKMLSSQIKRQKDSK